MSRPVLLVAGGSRGIGAATAKLAGARGYDVAVNYKTNSNAAAAVVKAVEKGGGKAIAIQGDMAVENDIEQVFDTASDTFGSLTHFVHSSGIIGDNSRLDEVSTATIREVLDVDTFGALLCLRSCVRRMSKKHGGKGGAVVMLSSMAAPLGGANECVWYAAAKAGVDSMVIGRFARSGEGRHTRQRCDAWCDRYRYPAARTHRTGFAYAADGPGGPGGRGSGSRSVPALRCGVLYQWRKLARFGRPVTRLALTARLPMIAAQIQSHDKQK